AHDVQLFREPARLLCPRLRRCRTTRKSHPCHSVHVRVQPVGFFPEESRRTRSRTPDVKTAQPYICKVCSRKTDAAVRSRYSPPPRSDAGLASSTGTGIQLDVLAAG